MLVVAEKKLRTKDYLTYIRFFVITFFLMFGLAQLVFYIFEVNNIPRTCGFECKEYSCEERVHNVINMSHYLIFYFLPLMIIFAFCLYRKLNFMNS